MDLPSGTRDPLFDTKFHSKEGRDHETLATRARRARTRRWIAMGCVRCVERPRDSDRSHGAWVAQPAARDALPDRPARTVTSLRSRGSKAAGRCASIPRSCSGGRRLHRRRSRRLARATSPTTRYTLDESHRLLTYVVSPTGDGHGPRARASDRSRSRSRSWRRSSQGKNPGAPSPVRSRERSRLLDPVGDKYPNPVLSIDQQYHP